MLWDLDATNNLPRGADKSLAQPGRKQARKHVWDARDFNNIETRAVIYFFPPCKVRRRRKFTPFWFSLQGTAPKEIHAILIFLARQGAEGNSRHSDFPCKTRRRRKFTPFWFSFQDEAPKEIHAILTETLACFLPGRAKDLSVTL